jgi:hypothetical protein
MDTFNVKNELKKLKTQTKDIRVLRYKKSRLELYRGELLSLYKNGASKSELQRWLRTKKIKVVWSTVSRWIDQNG